MISEQSLRPLIQIPLDYLLWVWLSALNPVVPLLPLGIENLLTNHALALGIDPALGGFTYLGTESSLALGLY